MIKNNEVWRDIEGYEGKYQVSNLGRVKSLSRIYKSGVNESSVRNTKNLIMKPHLNSNGYKRIDLCKDGKYKRFFIHRLVAKAFIPNPNNYPQVNHKNEIKDDNVVDNLEWCTLQYNMTYNDKHKKIGLKLRKPVIQYDEEFNKVKEYPYINKCLDYDFTPQAIVQCCKDEELTHKGYHWRYADD